MKKKFLFILGFVFCCLFMLPDYRVAAQVQSLPRPTKSTKFDFNGSDYVVYLNVDESIGREIEESYDKYISDYTTRYYVHGNDKYGYQVEAYFFKNKKKKLFDSQTASDSGYAIGKGKAHCIMYLDNKYAKGQGLAYRYRVYTIDDNGNKIYSDYSKETVIVPYVSGNYRVLEGKDDITVYWSKMKGAKSYTLYIYGYNGKKSKKITTTKKNYAKISKKNFKRNVFYYYYVKANGIKYKNKKYSSSKQLDIDDYDNFLYVGK
ncbi:MAG: hypothetical protein K2K56_08955 [Lachnospiraceae bacterium]|nr:hypothetical protein [Lachnospiraceae bacterium]